jgi:hypothetical protein
MEADTDTRRPWMRPDDSVTLRLEPGFQYGRAHIEPAADIPSGPLVLDVPLFPGAVPTSEVQLEHSLSYPATEYLKTAIAAYKVAVDRETASDWYRVAFEERGYMVRGTMESRSHGVFQSAGLWFESRADSKIRVSLSVQDLPLRQTHVLYLATAVTLPASPADSNLPDDIERIIVDYRPWNSGLQDVPRSYVVAEPSAVQSLVRTINSLWDAAPGTILGARDNGQGAWMTFVSRAGSEIGVAVKPSHRLVTVGSSRALVDTTGVWAEISRLLGSPPDGSGPS